MNSRVNAFAGLTETPIFEVKPKNQKPVAADTVDRIADDNGFQSRPVRKAKVATRKPRIYRTGRNRNFSLKATNETVDRFYKLADERQVRLGELLELALDALEGS